MQFLWIIVSLIMSVLSVDAQSVDKQSVSIVKKSLTAKSKNSEKNIPKEEKTETTNDDKKNNNSKDKSDKNKDTKQVKTVNAKSKEYTKKTKENIIIDDSDAIFPKSKTNFFINPIFKKNEFRASEAFKQDKDIGFKPEATSGKGINSQFLTPRKQIQEKDIPPELKHLFKDKVY